MAGEEGDADACAGLDRLAADAERLVDRSDNSLCNLECVSLLFDAGEDDHELVAAEAGGGVAGPEERHQAFAK